MVSPKRRAMPIMSYPGLYLVGGSVNDMVHSAQKQLGCITALAARYPSAAALTVMDLSVEAEAFGAPVAFSDDEVPTVTEPIIFDLDGAKRLVVPEVEEGRTSIYIETVRLAAEVITERPVLGGMIGPYSLATRLRDMTMAMMDLMVDPDLIHTLLKKTTMFLIKYAQAFKAAGANGVVIAEPAAGLLSAEHCHEFSSDYIRQIVEAVQDEFFMVVLHNCGNVAGLIPSFLTTGVWGIHFGNAVDAHQVLRQVPDNILVSGNLDPTNIFRHGKPDLVYHATIDLLKNTQEYPNFLISSGCDIPPQTPIENIDAFFCAVE